ncbi:MAG TPA: WYL domain-containing protein, partial [Bacteroidales bacterium]|nr:WYL domain-containing protein [Bacteroidales bacterium]
MSKHGEIRRYSLILEIIRNNHYPSFQTIKEHLHGCGFQVGDRTIQRDIEQIRYDFGVEVVYDHYKKGYW